MTRVKQLTLLLVAFLMAGCANIVISPERIAQIKQSKKDALLLVSIGRNNPTLNDDEPYYPLSFVDYDVILKACGTEFIVTELRIKGVSDNYNNGVIHLKDIPAGKYKLAGKKTIVTSSMALPVGGAGYVFLDNADTIYVNVIFEVDIKPGKVNYIGELLVVENDLLDLNSVEINNRVDRDLKFVQKKNNLAKSDVVVNLAKRVDTEELEEEIEPVIDVACIKKIKKDLSMRVKQNRAGNDS